MIKQQGWVTTDDGVELYYTALGDGPHVVCVPAGFYFEKEFERLAGGRTFVLLHQRGRGRSRVPEGAIVDIPHEAADLEVVRRAIGIDRWSLIGWSYMGLVTSLYAIEHPSAVERLVHLCSLGPDQATYATNDVQAVMLARADPVELERWNDMRQQGMAESDPVTLTKQFMRVICSAQMFDRSALERVPMEACEWPNEWLWRGGREAWQSSFDAWDERARLRSMRAPMLVVHAMEDLIPIEAARDTAATVPEARLFTIDRSGHWPWLERPDVFFPAVDSFLNGEWPEGADLVDE